MHGVLKGDIMRRKILTGLLIAALVGTVVTVLVLAQHAQPSVDIMAGSSFITNIIQDVAGDKLETRTLIPPGSCPGHYGVKPGDIKALANSTAFFIHNYQQNYENVTGAIEAADNPDLIITVISEFFSINLNCTDVWTNFPGFSESLSARVFSTE